MNESLVESSQFSTYKEYHLQGWFYYKAILGVSTSNDPQSYIVPLNELNFNSVPIVPPRYGWTIANVGAKHQSINL